jgi:serine/threonine protein kinase
MSATVDSATLAQRALLLGLCTQSQLDACCEGDPPPNDPEAFARLLERKGVLTNWQTNKLLKGDLDGYILGNYRLLYRISSGTFGRVFRADDARTGEVVAVKVLRRRWSNDPRAVELFEREARLGMGLRHPNVVSILSVGKDGPSRQHYIVMEFVEGGNLREFLAARKKLGAVDALRIIEEATAGLAYAFTRGITHRDIKLSNILISSQLTAKLVDFGLAGVCAGGSQEEEVDRSIDYAGLEKATNVPPGDVRSDIYFLGCVLYEMLTGRSPLVTTKDRQQRMQRERFEKVEPMGADAADSPPEVHQLVELMMSLAPNRRYQTPAQLLKAIRAARQVVEGKAAVGDLPSLPEGPPLICLVEKDSRLRDLMAAKLQEMGYRVCALDDPEAVLPQYRAQPFHALVVDVGSVGESGLSLARKALREAKDMNLPWAGVLLLSEHQAALAEYIPRIANLAILIRPLTFRDLVEKLYDLVPPRKESSDGAT